MLGRACHSTKTYCGHNQAIAIAQGGAKAAEQCHAVAGMDVKGDEALWLAVHEVCVNVEAADLHACRHLRMTCSLMGLLSMMTDVPSCNAAYMEVVMVAIEHTQGDSSGNKALVLISCWTHSDMLRSDCNVYLEGDAIC